MSPGATISGHEAARIIDGSTVRSDLTTGYNPSVFYQYEDKFIFSGKIIETWTERLANRGFGEGDLPVILLDLFYSSEAEFERGRDEMLIESLRKGVPIPPKKLAEGSNEVISDEGGIREFHARHRLLNVGSAINKKMGMQFYQNLDGTAVSVNAPQLGQSDQLTNNSGHIVIRQRFDSVEHLVRWLAYWNATASRK